VNATSETKLNGQRKVAREFSRRLDRQILPAFEPIQKSLRMRFCGLQIVGQTYMPLWTLQESSQTDERFIKDTTLSEATLKARGYFVPNPTGWKTGQEFDPNSAD
jgi:hypothetical protein